MSDRRVGGENPRGLSIVPIDSRPESEVLDLLGAALGEGPSGRSEAIWAWKHRESPFGPSPGLAAVSADGTLAGVRLFLRWRWIAGEGCLRAVRAVDTATAPGWQRRGVFRRLTEALVERMRSEGCDLIFNTPNVASGAGYLRMGWTAVGRVPLWIRPLRPARLITRWWRRDGDSRSRREDETAEPPPPARKIADLLAAPGVPAFLDRLWPGEGRIHTARSADYLAWRYRPPQPGPRYGALWRLDAAGGAVVVIRSRRRRGLNETLLCEVLTAGGEAGSRIAAALIDKIAAGSRADYLAACAPRRTPERVALRSAGFIPAGRRGPLLTVRPLSVAAAGLAATRWKTWRTSIGDLELF